MESENLIIVTGYDVFAGHEEKNASWEAVRKLPEKVEIDQKVFKIKKLKCEVKYDDVDRKVEEIWKQNPHLVIHVGVHGYTSKIKLERCAYNGFPSCDYSSKSLCEPIVCLEKSGKCPRLETKIDVETIVERLNETHRGDMFEVSCDVGRYLCGYIYLKSLDKAREKVLFVHVPCIDKPFSTDETSIALYKIIEQCLTTSKLK